MTPLDLLLPRFATFLAGCWEDLLPFFENDTTGSLQIDWLQGNWELLVEAQAEVPGRLVL